MKTHILSFLFIVLLFIFPINAAAVDYVHINEIMYDSPLNEVITTPPYSNGEYIELYNAGSAPVNLAGWKLLGDGVSEIYEFEDVNIPARSLLIVAYRHSRSPEFQLSQVFPGIAAYADKIIYQNKITLKNTKEYIRLYDAAGLLRDSIYYGNETSIQPISDRLIATNADGITGSECLSVQRKKVEFNALGVAEANHLHWHVSLAAPLHLSTAYVQPDIDVPLNLALSATENYIVTLTPTEAVSKIERTGGDYILSNGGKALVDIQYLDGLGRPVQTVQKGITPAGNDLVSLTEYDAFGREYRQWLPVPVSGNKGACVDPVSLQVTANNLPHYSEGHPYSDIIYEYSPLNRVLGNRNPGTDFHSHPTGIGYSTNTAGEVLQILPVGDDGIRCNKYYDAGSLFKTIYTDEDGNISYEYKNKLGQVILISQPDQVSGRYDTYYVYDDFGNRIYVLPPLCSINRSTHYTDNHELIKQYAYVYKYDERNRCIQKRLPGCEWVYMVYDRSDRLVLSQDGNQRGKDKWSVHKYDRLGRLLYSAEIVDTQSHAAWLTWFYDRVMTEEFSTGTLEWPMSDTGYSCGYFHNRSTDVLTVNYYDTYDFLELPAYRNQKSLLSYQPVEGYDKAYVASPPVGDSGGLNARGLLTGTRTYLLDGSGKYLTEVYYYDYRGRVVQKRATNHLDGYDIEYNKYDFAGNLLKSLIQHQGQTPFTYTATEVYSHTYDHAGRLIQTKYKLDDKEEITLVENQYDELGRLTIKARHNRNNKTEYEYNIRSWLTTIRDSEFEQKLYYNNNPFNHAVNYNGNISYSSWTYGNNIYGYKYGYDKLNRLTRAESVSESGNALSGEGYTERYGYDSHGNITSLWRYSNGAVIDILSFTYTGNQLIRVKDNAQFNNATEGLYNLKEYVERNQSSNLTFAYDTNGNTVKDLDREIVTIRYNLLNLPDTVQFADGRQIINTYASDGRKLKTRYYALKTQLLEPITAGSTLNLGGYPTYLLDYELTDYVHNKEYELTEPKHYGYSAISRISNTEGYVKNGKYHYYRRDHLGNNREVWQTEGNSITTIQRTQYYPGGLPWAEGEGAGEQSYKYTGKEFIEMHGYNMYDSYARMYDPLIYRTPTPDPLAEKFPWLSPYAWCSNNPVNRFDPDGRQDQWGADFYGYHGVRTQRSRALTNSGQAHISDLKSFSSEEKIITATAFLTMATITGIGVYGDAIVKVLSEVSDNNPAPDSQPNDVKNPYGSKGKPDH